MDVQLGRAAVERRIAELAAAQHGVVSRQQLMGSGLGRGALQRRLEAGRLHPVHRGVYSVGHRLIGAEGRWMAAVLACGAGAVLSHRSAGALWGLRPSSAPRMEVTVVASGGRPDRNGIRVHRVTALAPEEVARCRGIPVTSPARTLADLAGVLSRDALRRAVERAEMLALFDLGAVQAVLARAPRRHGVPALRDVLEGYADVGLTRSELEERFLELCSVHGVSRPIVNARVGAYEVDFLWRDERVIVETDGRRHHLTSAAFERDRARDARLAAAGYRVLRFTYRQIVNEPAVVAEIVRAVLREARRRHR